MTSLSSARELAARSLQYHQKKYDKRATEKQYKKGEWVLVKLHQEESGNY